MSGNSRHFICHMDELADPGCKGNRLTLGDAVHNVFVVRRDDTVFGYINSCPHTGVPLDWVPEQFLSMDRRYIQCATHDALFRIDDGVCIAGPCSGDHLTAVKLQIVCGNIFLLTGSLEV